MVRSTPITPAAARTGESHSHPRTWTGNFPATFWAMALSWSAAMSNCGHFSWLYSEPCSLFPVGLGRNWYFLLQPQKNLSQTMVRWSEKPSSTAFPSPLMLSIPYPSYVDIPYLSLTQAHTVQASALTSSFGRQCLCWGNQQAIRTEEGR